jgi:hypothetical protein
MKFVVPRRVLPLFLCALLLAPLAFAGFGGTETVLAGVGNPVGSGGAHFFTTVWVTNLGIGPVSFTFYFLQSGQANLSPSSFSDTLAAGQTRMYEDVIATKLFLTNVNGAARIVSTGEIFVAARLYNQPAGLLLSQTAGQFFAGVPKNFSIGLGQSASLQGVYLGVGQDFRYNYALVETSGAACSVHVQALDNLGALLGATDQPLLPYEHLLLSASNLAPSASTNNARLVATVTSGTGTVLFAGSQIGNAGPQDQSGFDMSYPDFLLGSAGVTSLNGLTGAVTLSPGTNVTFGGSGNNIIINAAGGGGGGLSFVTHDGTLTGNGTGGSPLAVAAPLNLANGETTFTAAGPTIGVFASTTDTVITPASPAILGTAPVLGVYGQATNGSGAQSWGELGRFFNSHYFGMLGFTHDASTGAAAIYGDQNFGSGTTPTFPIGVWGDSHDGTGVLGTSSSTIDHQWYGVVGYGALGVEGIGMVAGTNGGGTFSYGVEGDSYLFGDLRVGVFGYATGGTTNYAGYFLGNVNINGTVHTSGAAVRLDNPLDPENKYIYHSSVESADMKNLYDGVVTLDARGDAVVQLPQWFEALNRDFRYQLTCIGGFSPVWIEREVAGGQFVIKGEKPGQRVSWQLTGIRHDSWADAHRIPVEVDKPESERGTLLNPADLGQPLERSLEWRINPEYQKAVEKQREAEAKQAQESKN